MTEQTNTYFRAFEKKAETYARVRAKMKAERNALIEAKDWDALKAYDEKEKEATAPYLEGEARAYRAWKRSLENEASHFEVEDLPWDRDLPNFVLTLRRAGVAEFAVTDQSTALMRSLHLLAANGCTVEGLCKVERTERCFREQRVSREGILVRL